MNKYLGLYEKVRHVPKEAINPIMGGRLKGKSDINPMWCIKTLTEQFGICGIGWKVEIFKSWLEEGGNGEIGAFVQIKLYVKENDTWSDGIPGTGGSMFVAKENSGMFVDDECFKKAYTDALSVACKLLGIGADVYWEKDNSKYETDSKQSDKKPESKQSTNNKLGGKNNYALIAEMIKDTDFTMDDVNEYIKDVFKKPIKLNDLTETQFKKVVTTIKKATAA